MESAIVRLGAFEVHSADVLRALDRDETVRNRFGSDAEIIVPKTMIVGNSFDRFSRLALATTLDCESYKSRAVGKALRYRTGEGITHLGIDTDAVSGRKRGECSVIMGTETLKGFAAIHFSEGLITALKYEAAVVAYAMGNQNFLLMRGNPFMTGYGEILQKTGVKSNL